MEDRLITTKEVGNYRIKIYYDTDSVCPCESWDMAACFLWEYSDSSRLQYVCDWREVFGKYGDSRHSLIDALHKLISEYVEWKDLLNYFKKGKIDGYRMRYDNHDKMWYLEWYDNYQYTEHKGYKEIISISPSDLYTYNYTYEFIEDLEREEYAREIEGIILRDVESCQGDWFNIDKEIFMQPENENKAFILGTRKTGCDLIILGGTNCDEGSMDWLFGSLGNENFYVCQPVSFYKSQREIQKVNPLYAFKVATAYFREQGKVPVFEDSNCRLIKL